MNDNLNNENIIDANNMLATIGDCVIFTYKGGRNVCGEILYINTNSVVLKLKSDYIGKKAEWFVGEKKSFNIKECKDFRLDNRV